MVKDFVYNHVMILRIVPEPEFMMLVAKSKKLLNRNDQGMSAHKTSNH